MHPLSPAARGVPFWRHLLKSLPVMIVVSVAMNVFEGFGWFAPFHRSALDSLVLLQHRRQVNDIVVVEITEDDYRSPALFDGHSPLDRQRLRALLSAVIAGNPKLIVVDLDTSGGCREGSIARLRLRR